MVGSGNCLVRHWDKVNGSKTEDRARPTTELVGDIIDKRIQSLEGRAPEEHTYEGMVSIRKELGLDELEDFADFGPRFDEKTKRALSKRIDGWVLGIVKSDLDLPGEAHGPADTGFDTSDIRGEECSVSRVGTEKNMVHIPPSSQRHLNISTSPAKASETHDVGLLDEIDVEKLVQEQVRVYQRESLAAAEVQKAADDDAETLKKTYLESQLGGSNGKTVQRKLERELLKTLRATKMDTVVGILRGKRINSTQILRAWKLAVFGLHPDRKKGATNSHEKAIFDRLMTLKARLTELKD